SFHTEIGWFGNVHEPIPAGKTLNKRAEFFHRNDPSLIGLANLDLARHPADDFFRARHAFGARGVNMHRTVVVDVNFGAGLGDNAFDGFAAGPDEGADLLGVDLDWLGARRVFRQFGTRFLNAL